MGMGNRWQGKDASHKMEQLVLGTPHEIHLLKVGLG